MAPPVECAWQDPIGDPRVTVFLGSSGSGKTTILRCLAGLERPHRGHVRFGDRTWFDAGARHPPATGSTRSRRAVPGLRALPAHDRSAERRLRRARNARRRRSRSGSPNCSTRSASAASSIACRVSSRAASSSASPLPARSSDDRSCCSSMNRSRRSIVRPATRFAKSFDVADSHPRDSRLHRQPRPRRRADARGSHGSDRRRAHYPGRQHEGGLRRAEDAGCRAARRGSIRSCSDESPRSTTGSPG